MEKRRENCLEKNAVFWDVALCGSCKTRRFGGTYRFHLQDRRNNGSGEVLDVANRLNYRMRVISCALKMDKFLRNACSYKTHKATHSRTHSP
jgi:hypothetical protein